VKPIARRNKTDAAEVAAICEAALRPGQRFVPLRSVDNQAAMMRHRIREQLVEQRTALLNALRGHLSEIGIIAPQGVQHAYPLIRLIENGFDDNGEVVVCESVCAALAPLAKQIEAIDKHLAAIDAELGATAKSDERAKALMTVPGIGPVIATAILATVGDISSFASGREFAAYLGLTPRQHSSGGKHRSGGISKMGDRYLRKLLVVGATAALSHAAGHNDRLRRWAKDVMKRKANSTKYAFKLTAVALANKLARIVFAILRSGEAYDDRPVAA
jgi:transposase